MRRSTSATLAIYLGLARLAGAQTAKTAEQILAEPAVKAAMQSIQTCTWAFRR